MELGIEEFDEHSPVQVLLLVLLCLLVTCWMCRRGREGREGRREGREGRREGRQGRREEGRVVGSAEKRGWVEEKGGWGVRKSATKEEWDMRGGRRGEEGVVREEEVGWREEEERGVARYEDPPDIVSNIHPASRCSHTTCL